MIEAGDIMFLAHFAGWSEAELMEMTLRDLHFWTGEAVKLHNKLNPPPPNSDSP